MDFIGELIIGGVIAFINAGKDDRNDDRKSDISA